MKSGTGGPTAKAFNVNFASLYDQVAAASINPGDLWCGDEEARAAVETLNRDAGFDPICAGPSRTPRSRRASSTLVFAINQGGMGPFFYQMAPPDQF